MVDGEGVEDEAEARVREVRAGTEERLERISRDLSDFLRGIALRTRNAGPMKSRWRGRIGRQKKDGCKDRWKIYDDENEMRLIIDLESESMYLL